MISSPPRSPVLKFIDSDSDIPSSNSSMMSLNSWRQAIRTPTPYRVGNSTLRIQTQFIAIVALIGLFILVMLYATVPSVRNSKYAPYSNLVISRSYNSTYPLTPPIRMGQSVHYRIGIVSDLDTDSKSSTEPNTWISYFKKGYLVIDRSDITLRWDDEHVVLKSTLAQGGRGMELSELVVFDGRLLTVDDRTGVVYEIYNDQVIPWVLLTDGNGKSGKGFKCEWATVKDEHLYVGGLGKEWTSLTGELLNYNPLFVKSIAANGEIYHIDWKEKYLSLRGAVKIEFPGYMIHESSVWSYVHNRWFFLPRRASSERYDEVKDERRGTNYMLIASPSFNEIVVQRVGIVIPTHGFSSFKFIPGTDDRLIVALKSEEINGKTATYITVFDIDGKTLLGETKVGDVKYEDSII